MHLTKKVEAILKEREQTRNSDIELTLWVWYTWYRDLLEWLVDEELPDGGRWVAPLNNVRQLPSEDKISRIRRKFQEPSKKYPQGRYLATDPAVIAARAARERKVRAGVNSKKWDEVLS